jgi:hypothetical protein
MILYKPPLHPPWMIKIKTRTKMAATIFPHFRTLHCAEFLLITTRLKQDSSIIFTTAHSWPHLVQHILVHKIVHILLGKKFYYYLFYSILLHQHYSELFFTSAAHFFPFLLGRFHIFNVNERTRHIFPHRRNRTISKFEKNYLSSEDQNIKECWRQKSPRFVKRAEGNRSCLKLRNISELDH